jgi:Nitrile hydratase beta subunit
MIKKLEKEDIWPAVSKCPVFVRESNLPKRFDLGDTIKVRFMTPAGHTRLPRYARGHVGTVQAHRGVFIFPDTNAHSAGEKPQHLYNVRFSARELWGDGANPAEFIYLDLWDDYIIPAEHGHG